MGPQRRRWRDSPRSQGWPRMAKDGWPPQQPLEAEGTQPLDTLISELRAPSGIIGDSSCRRLLPSHSRPSFPVPQAEATGHLMSGKEQKGPRREPGALRRRYQQCARGETGSPEGARGGGAREEGPLGSDSDLARASLARARKADHLQTGRGTVTH